jgi:hypothetical protein
MTLQWSPFLVGGIGWTLALSLRAPVAIIIRYRLRRKRYAHGLLVASSGPLEESIRLIAIWISGTTVDTAISLGFGWASAEMLYVILNTIGLIRVRRSQRKAHLGEQQLGQGLLTRMGLMLGIIERLSATTFHLGASLMLAVSPLLVIATTPIHSSLNLLALCLARRSLVTTEFIIAILSALVLMLGLFFHRAF